MKCELFAIQPSAQQMPFLRARLMAVISPVVQPGDRFHEFVLRAR
jgi:hypothetical protein